MIEGFIVCMLVGAAAIGVGLFANWHAERSRLQWAVFGNLNEWDYSAILAYGTAEDIAEDLSVYAEDLAGELPSKLVPHVRLWMRQKGL